MFINQKNALAIQEWDAVQDALDEEYGSSSVSFPIGGYSFEADATFGLSDDELAGTSSFFKIKKECLGTVCWKQQCIGVLGAAALGYFLGKRGLSSAVAFALGYLVLAPMFMKKPQTKVTLA